MTKAEQILSKECHRYTDGVCNTRICLVRGGWVRGKLPVGDRTLATCEIHEAILEIKELEKPRYKSVTEMFKER